MRNSTAIHAATALAVAVLLGVPALAAEDPDARQGRGDGPRQGPRFERSESAPPPAAGAPAAGPETRALPPRARQADRPDRAGARDGQANAQRRRGGGGRDGGGTVIIDGSRRSRGRVQGPPPRVYTVRPRGTVAPRRIYPYAYGAFGLGYFYYDPYWSPWGPVGRYGYPGGYYGYYGGGYQDDLGKVRLDVKGPGDAQVLVDGYYAGELDDFDGAFQGLDLEAGTYRIEVAAEGFEPLTFDTRVTEGRKLTLHGALHRAND
ncbi:MAG: PEGA domain-containing protein [Vicinamibacterales bacterium]|nr:PEGA domain-containing protein [Vicinamibacterales bacterium]